MESGSYYGIYPPTEEAMGRSQKDSNGDPPERISESSTQKMERLEKENAKWERDYSALHKKYLQKQSEQAFFAEIAASLYSIRSRETLSEYIGGLFIFFERALQTGKMMLGRYVMEGGVRKYVTLSLRYREGKHLKAIETPSEFLIDPRGGRVPEIIYAREFDPPMEYASSTDEIFTKFPGAKPLPGTNMPGSLLVATLSLGPVKRIINDDGYSYDFDEFVGLLIFQSRKKNAFDESFRSMVDRIRPLVAGAIGNFLKLDEADKKTKLDRLTGLMNRAAYDEEIARALAESMRNHVGYSLLVLDVDRFKVFNDTYGHDVGDTVLASVAKILGDTLQRPSDFVFRYGGEEFVVLLKSTPLEGAIIVAEKMRYAIESEAIVLLEKRRGGTGMYGTKITVSIGVANLEEVISCAGNAPRHDLYGADERLFRLADGRTYVAKEQGRNCVISEGTRME